MARPYGKRLAWRANHPREDPRDKRVILHEICLQCLKESDLTE